MRSMLFLVDQRVERVVLRFERFDLCLVHWCHSLDRKSTRLNSSHLVISYAVFCLKKKNAIPMAFSLYFPNFPARAGDDCSGSRALFRPPVVTPTVKAVIRTNVAIFDLRGIDITTK